MTIGAFSCLAKGLKALRANLFSTFVFALLLEAIGTIPTFIDRLQGHEYLTPPFSPWGLLMSLIFWITQTLILIGVSQVVWDHLKKDPHEPVHLLPSEKVRPQLFLWSIAFTVMTFVPLLGSWLVVQMASTPVHFTPLPILPFVFYFVAFIPLMMIDQQISSWKAMKQVLFSMRNNFVSLLKLALTAEAVFLAIAILGDSSGEFIRDIFSILESVVTDYVIWVFVCAPIWVINGAMMAVAYAELQGLSAVGHQASGNPVYEGR
jgi:hypothetical protein